ncbi:MAG: hypothetical protein FWG61_08600 [Firmicutes bacterium]|nr:hypothetical protein [Bacillota bacterium]
MTQDDEPVYVSVPGYTSSFCSGRIYDMCSAIDTIIYNISKYINMDFANANVETEMELKAQIMVLKCYALNNKLSSVSFE